MSSRPRPAGARQGTILIIVAGMSALLATMALTFVAKMRADAEESALVLQEAQARIMLAAACNYIQEGSRIGWDTYKAAGSANPTDANDAFPGDPNSSATVPVHEETFGWIDTRDGSSGPKTQEGRVCWTNVPAVTWAPSGSPQRPLWPAPTSIVRCPMYVWQRPPCATQLTAAYNPILTDPNQTSNPTYLYPFLHNPDPQPQVSNGWVQLAPGTNPPAAAPTISTTLYDDGANGATQSDFIHGDPTPRTQTMNKSWFRVLREGPATFLITVGAGGTMGFRSYSEASAQGFATLFNSDSGYFQDLSDHEMRMWYRVEWSAAVTDVTYHWNLHHTLGWQDNYTQWPQNASHSWAYGPRSSGFDRNMGGTFRWIERLRTEPTFW
jgi:type II secretory pathway pseudopilin PulG